MRQHIKKTLLFISTVFIASLMLTNCISADATIEITPEMPQPLDTIEVTAQITDENINAVYVIIQECNDNTGICYQKENISMTQTTEGEYSTSMTLTHSDATYLQYTVAVQTDQGWIEYNKDMKVIFDVSSDSNGDGTGDNDTPGFEFMVAAFSIILITLLFYKRKR